MQKFSKFNANDYLYNGIPKMYDDICSVASNFSGDAFPTDNLFVGMTCYRRDQAKIYTLKQLDGNTPTWVMTGDLNIAPGVAEYDDKGNHISDHYLSVHGGTVDKPIKYSGSDLSDSAMLVPKSYVDDLVESTEKEVKGTIGDNNTAVDNNISGLKKNGVDKLSTTHYINGHPFNGTQDVNIAPADIRKSSNDASQTPSVDSGAGVTAAAIGKPNKKSIASISPLNITVSEYALRTVPAFGKNQNLTLEQILDTLIRNCHTHSSYKKSTTAAVNCWGDCNCNCDCNCDCGDDSGS